jgi:hypothetical protein
MQSSFGWHLDFYIGSLAAYAQDRYVLLIRRLTFPLLI